MFLSEDPIGILGGTNLYGYAGGDPVNHVDPLGLQEVSTRTTTYEVPDIHTHQPGCPHTTDYGCVTPIQHLQVECTDCGTMNITLTIDATVVVRAGTYTPFAPFGPKARPLDPDVVDAKSATRHENDHVKDLENDSRRFLRHFQRKYRSPEECRYYKGVLERNFPYVFGVFAERTQDARH
jgi:uncharacterized protein RhaS with RHS repeats